MKTVRGCKRYIFEGKYVSLFVKYLINNNKS